MIFKKVLMTEEQLTLFSELQENKKTSYAGAGMLSAGVGMGVAGHYLGKKQFKNYMTKTPEGISMLLEAPRDGLGKEFRRANKNEMLDSLINSAKGKGSKEGVKSARKLWGYSGLRAAGVGLGIAGVGKMAYDHFKKKK